MTIQAMAIRNYYTGHNHIGHNYLACARDLSHPNINVAKCLGLKQVPTSNDECVVIAHHTNRFGPWVVLCELLENFVFLGEGDAAVDEVEVKQLGIPTMFTCLQHTQSQPYACA